ncbi:MAG: NAD-dependent epimerase/dehydratase family protein [Myxococcales bacterium]|nr:NAD-dependent epimerase/dehydratase family protein [Myxococcales bacterium]
MTPTKGREKPQPLIKDFLSPGTASLAGEFRAGIHHQGAPAAPAQPVREAKPARRKRNGGAGGKHLNILITGVTTSIGRNLVMHLAGNKRVGVILGVGHRDKPYYFNDLPKEKFIYHKCNILKGRELKNLFLSKTFRAAQINAVVHLAFHNQPLRGEDIHRLNVEGTRDLLRQCIETPGITKFVFKSSDVVYKLTPHNPVYLDENAPLNFDPGVDQWIKDRVDADMICRSFMDNGAVKIVILRMTNIIGRNISGQFNSYFDSKPVIKTMGFNPLVNLLHMKDVIQSITLALTKNVAGIYNIGGLDTAPISVFAQLNGRGLISLPEPLMGLANLVQRTFGLTEYYYSVDKERQKYSALLDIGKARRELGYEPKGRIEF